MEPMDKQLPYLHCMWLNKAWRIPSMLLCIDCIALRRLSEDEDKAHANECQERDY